MLKYGQMYNKGLHRVKPDIYCNMSTRES